MFSVYMWVVRARMAQKALKYTYFWDTLYCLYFKMLNRSLLNNYVYTYAKMIKFTYNEFKINFTLYLIINELYEYSLAYSGMHTYEYVER